MWSEKERAMVQERLVAGAVRLALGLGDLARPRRCETGQSMVEYAIVVALVAIIAMAAIQAFGQGISQVFTKLMTDIQGIG